MRIVAISDTHGLHEGLQIPDGDLLIHAGDCTMRGDLDELDTLDAFLAALPHRDKVLVAGNHDWCFQREPDAARARIKHAHYLEDEAIEIGGLRLYGSPWQPWFLDWAFNLPRGAPLRERWARIPARTDVLVTHGPPLGHGDRVRDGSRVGCEDLMEAVRRVRPLLHVFGHIHEDAGRWVEGATTLVNASICSLAYVPVQPPVIIDL